MSPVPLLFLMGDSNDLSGPAYLFFLLLAITLSAFGMMLPALLPLAAAGTLAGIIGLSVAVGRRDAYLVRAWKWVLAPSAALVAACLAFLGWVML